MSLIGLFNQWGGRGVEREVTFSTSSIMIDAPLWIAHCREGIVIGLSSSSRSVFEALHIVEASTNVLNFDIALPQNHHNRQRNCKGSGCTDLLLIIDDHYEQEPLIYESLTSAAAKYGSNCERSVCCLYLFI